MQAASTRPEHQPPQTGMSTELRAMLERGAALHRAGRGDEASIIFHDVLTQYPDQPDALHLLGVIERSRGNFEQARRLLERAVAINPRFAPAQYNLGNLYMSMKLYLLARDAFERTLEIKPDHTDALNNLTNVYFELGTVSEVEALIPLMSAMKQSPNNPLYWQNFNAKLEGRRLSAVDESLRTEFLRQIKANVLAPDSCLQCVFNFIACGRHFNQVMRLISQSNWDESWCGPLEFKELSEPFLSEMLSLVGLPDISFEKLFTLLRRKLLFAWSEGKLGEWIDTSSEALLFGIAHQCYLNEYVYFQSEEEQALLPTLEASLENIELDHDETPWLLALFGSYRPLWRLSIAERIPNGETVRGQSLFARLIRRQITEPLREQALLPSIQSLTEVQDATSKKVQEQYEANPYPRWDLLEKADPKPVHIIVRNTLVYLPHNALKQINSPDILIAGCGTGKHALYVAQNYEGAQVIAMDISKAALAFAKRKAEEYGIRNVEFYHGDLLELGSIGRQFDVVESVGVLHHMRDPLAGWTVLTSLLKPGGLMKIGLYSATAREEITRVREETDERGDIISDDFMRAYRHDVIWNPEKKDRFERLRGWRDFFSLSECRDVLFHVQEHQFTIDELEGLIAAQPLAFLGMEMGTQKMFEAFRAFHGSANGMDSLAKWKPVEEANPRLFDGMYQFWLQKTA